MAPRTRQQQDEYNKKRREANALKLSAKSAPVATPKPKQRSKPVVSKPQAYMPGSPEVIAQTERVRAKLAEAKANKRKRPIPAITRLRKSGGEIEARRVIKGQSALIQAYKQVLEAAPKIVIPIALAKGAPVIQAGTPRTHTMARSYVRTSGAGQGKLRAGTYQVTVSFTPDQRNQIIAAAGFRCVSLAEMIRSCVVDHLNKRT